MVLFSFRLSGNKKESLKNETQSWHVNCRKKLSEVINRLNTNAVFFVIINLLIF